MTEPTTADVAMEIASTGGVKIVDLAAEFGVNRTSVFRWVAVGLPGSDGSRVKLAALRVGRAYRTSRGAIQRFFAKLPSKQ